MTIYEPGSVIAGYRIDSLIGRGGMAVVYRAEDMRLGRKVALKLLSPQLGDSEEFRQRFVRESRLAASLDHPNIVPIYEAGEADGQLYIAMRYVVGSDLKGLLVEQGGTLPLEWALRLVGQIGYALDAAHEAGLVHRDVKPANILVGQSREHPDDARDYHAYLTDFGVTKRASEVTGGLTGTGRFLGTVDYVSPEQIQGKPAGPGTDIYALGCVLYESLTGQPPFRRDDDAALLWAHLTETPPPITAIRPEVPEAVGAVVARAMAKDPADRYGSCEELVSELESALDMPAHVAGLLSEEALYEAAPPANEPALEMYPEPEQEHDAGSAADQRGPGTDSAPLPVADDRSRVVAAAAATPSVSREGPLPSGSPRRRPVVRVILVGLLALALGGAAVGANLLDPVDATPVVAEPADSTGDDPFAPPPTPGGAASGSAPPAGGKSALDTDGGAPTEDVPISGDTVGLYGGMGADACSAAFMAAFFDTHPDKAAAWARAQGIQPSDIRSFLRALTPLVLRSDTAVTNHGFRDGRANAYQAVLQAGTAVMVDEHGVPRVRCACGNPLGEPGARDQVRYTGDTWSELGRRPVTVIEPAPAVVEQFVVVVVQEDTTVVVSRPPGTDGDHDEPAASEVVEAAMEFSAEDPANDGSGEEPATDGSAGSGEEPATEEPATEEPVTEEPVTEEPATEEPVTEEPVTEEPVTEEPVTEEPVTEEPVTEEPVTEEPVTEEPVTEEPVTEEPVTEEPVTEEPVTEEPVTEEPVTEEPVTEEPVTEEPVTEEPVTEEPVTEEPVTEEPVTEEPATEEPATEEPATDGSAGSGEEPATDGSTGPGAE